MITILDLFLRLTIWFLLTADGSWANIAIGLAVALLLPRSSHLASSKLKDWLRALWEVLVAIPQAYWESVEIMVKPHRGEDIVLERVKPNRSAGLIFLDIFIITFTPKTIVVDCRADGWYEVHRILRRREQ
ncbi:MAG: Na+/H+ antiporter subunit E [Synechococcales cyanobacterium RM1_1_8]|nr:Na+/H+ antiporter subunit E [Synechococcales cyanobacterium RM1_1_8]